MKTNVFTRGKLSRPDDHKSAAFRNHKLFTLLPGSHCEIIKCEIQVLDWLPKLITTGVYSNFGSQWKTRKSIYFPLLYQHGSEALLFSTDIQIGTFGVILTLRLTLITYLLAFIELSKREDTGFSRTYTLQEFTNEYSNHYQIVNNIRIHTSGLS